MLDPAVLLMGIALAVRVASLWAALVLEPLWPRRVNLAESLNEICEPSF